ncbi:V-type ATP synthase subunit E [Clostridium grantii]|uniref:V-type proton ATPase subunit E n=1 Tax=Clostridium grantii DSM 8605 TaxID=1121316 RepID=A0A1M5RG04_9CLOT|nr:V-type ATP synthase subunit E [Clostridium grantii]SHH25191.1 V/A-type H+-transporting ATPase subunit E [Clostridium grantii DSM 8605]
MSNLNTLTSKIIEDANKKAEQLLAEARSNEKNIIDKSIAQAEKEGDFLIEKAKVESKTRSERVLSNAQLTVRNMKLEAKQQVLNNTFALAVEELSKISAEDHAKFIKESILSLPIDGDEEIIVGMNNSAVTPNLMLEINTELKKAGKLGTLKLSLEKREMKGGFVLAKAGIEINNTFEALVNSFRDELEAEVARALFN